MKKVNFQKLRAEQGCLTDSVAFFLNLHPQNVPLFVRPKNKKWNEELKAFFLKHGYRARWTNKNPLKGRGLRLVVGDSLKWKSYCHCVVYRGNKMVYDPQYPSLWSDKRATHKLVITKIKTKPHEKNH